MSNVTRLETLKQSFEQVVPKQDKRVKLPPLDFLSGLVFYFLGDTKSVSLESIRRDFTATFMITMSRSAFWERLAGQRLKQMLHDLLEDIMKKLPAKALIEPNLLKQLSVERIRLLDASIMTLWDGAKTTYPGTFMSAGVKWHACFDLLAGKLDWFKITAASVHDRKGFPDIKSLANQLIIFDLGYWDYGLLIRIAVAEGFFLSRVKSEAVFVIKSVVTGLSESYIDQCFADIKLKKKSQCVIEFLTDITVDEITKSFRVIGFWNPVENKYHWYITNLVVAAYVIYPLYKARWQIELMFKGCKQSFNLDKRLLVSNNDNIIESLVLSSIIASFATHVVLNISIDELTKEEQLAVSYQRLAHVVVLLSRDFIRYLTRSSAHYANRLIDKIKLMSREIFEKNHRRRPTTLHLVNNALNGG